MMPTTPTGSRVISTSTPGRTDGTLLAGQAQRLAGEEREDLAGARDFADAFRQGLAFLARQQAAELVLAREDFDAEILFEDVEALLRRRARPGREGGLGGGDRLLGLRLVGLGVFADDIVGVGGIDVPGDAGAVDPFAVDEVLEHGTLHVIRHPRVGGTRADPRVFRSR